MSWTAIAPKSVCRPVRTAKMRAAPLRTDAPMNTPLVRAASDALAGTLLARFTAGNVSPIIAASETRKSCASSTRLDAGTRLPAENSTMLPGTSTVTGTVVYAPPRSTRAVIAKGAF